MIEQLELTNIQKHDHLTLNFISGVNVISGATDTGKTAIFRGLIWALMNDGQADRLVKHGSNKCSVSVTVDDNVIERAWSSSSNTYKLNGELFKSFRTSVPGDIQKLVNMAPISIQSRRDLPFMVYYKGSETAEQFSTMLDLNEIQTVTTNTNRHVKQIQLKLEETKEKLNDAELSIGIYANVDIAKQGVNELLHLREKTQKCNEILTQAESLLSKVQSANKTLALNERFVDAEWESRHLELDEGVYQGVKYTYELNVKLLNKYNKIENTLKRYGSGCAEERVSELENLEDLIKTAKSSYNKLASLCTELKKWSGVAKALKQNLTDEEEKLKAYVGTICPTCGQVIGEI